MILWSKFCIEQNLYISLYAYWHIRTHNLNCRRWKNGSHAIQCAFQPSALFCVHFFCFRCTNANYMVTTCESMFLCTLSLLRWLSAWIHGCTRTVSRGQFYWIRRIEIVVARNGSKNKATSAVQNQKTKMNK